METIKCPQCGNLIAVEKAVQGKVEGKPYKFCSSSCAEAFREESIQRSARLKRSK